MDKIAQKANSARSLRGGKFETKFLGKIFTQMVKDGRIKSFEPKPSIFDGEFNPDFIIEKNDGTIISIDAATTARTDRIRGKQWDAYGTKKYFSEKGKKIKSYVVVKDTTGKKEKDNFRRSKARCNLPHTALDGVISTKELIALLEEK